MLIINADDFGKDALTNRAIISAFERGLCSSATIMANASSFEEACQLAHERKLAGRIGVHLTLDSYYPLTEKIKDYPKLCDKDGRLCLGRLSTFGRSFLMLGSSEKAGFAEEIRAQIRKCRAGGIALTHIDSHHHIHTAWVVSSIVISVAKEEGIRFIRLARNLGPDSSPFKAMYKHIFNRRLKMLHLAGTDYFGSIDDILYEKKRRDISGILRSCEIMVHPRLDGRGVLVEDSDGSELEAMIRQIDGHKDAREYA